MGGNKSNERKPFLVRITVRGVTFDAHTSTLDKHMAEVKIRRRIMNEVSSEGSKVMLWGSHICTTISDFGLSQDEARRISLESVVLLSQEISRAKFKSAPEIPKKVVRG